MMKFARIICIMLVLACLLAACTEENATSVVSTDERSVYIPDEPSEIPELSNFSMLDELSIDCSSAGSNFEVAESSEWENTSEESEEEILEQISKEPSESSSTESLPSEDNHDPRPHKVNGFIVYGDRGMEPFGGSAKGGRYTADVFNQFKERVGNDVTVYAMPIPLACTFYAPEGYEKSISCMADCFYGLRDALVDVKFVDLIAALNVHSAEDIYAKTDHHWMALGAYYAAEELSQVAGVNFAQLDRFTECSFDGFLGSIVTAYDVKELRKYPETFYWYEPIQEYTAHYYLQDYEYSFSGSIFSSAKSYVKFIRGDSYAVKIETGVKNGRKMLLIKDSFGNAMAPFLLAGFEEVYIVDYRGFECNVLEFIDDNKITDVAIALSAFGIASSSRDNIIRLMEQ